MLELKETDKAAHSTLKLRKYNERKIKEKMSHVLLTNRESDFLISELAPHLFVRVFFILSLSPSLSLQGFTRSVSRVWKFYPEISLVQYIF